MIEASQSTNEMIRWTARTLANESSADDDDSVKSTEISLLKVKGGRYNYVSSSIYRRMNVVWSIVQVASIHVQPGYEIDAENMEIMKCRAGELGGAAAPSMRWCEAPEVHIRRRGAR